MASLWYLFYQNHHNPIKINLKFPAFKLTKIYLQNGLTKPTIFEELHYCLYNYKLCSYQMSMIQQGKYNIMLPQK